MLDIRLGRWKLRYWQKPAPQTDQAYHIRGIQRRIVAGLDALQAEVDALKRLQAGTSAEPDALLPSILDRAFNSAL